MSIDSPCVMLEVKDSLQLTDIWFDICLSYFSKNDDNARKYMEYVDNLAPTTNDNNSVFINVLDTDTSSKVNSLLGIDIQKLISQDSSVWYLLNDSKNKARQKYHEIENQKRKESCIRMLNETQTLMNSSILELNQSSIYGNIIKKLIILLNHLDLDLSLYKSIICNIYVLIRSQVSELEYSLSLILDLEIIYERQAEIQTVIINFLMSIGTFDHNDTFSLITLRNNASNAFLQRLIRTMHRYLRRNNLIVPKVIYSRDFSEHHDTPNVIKINVLREKRMNAEGQNDDAMSIISNSILPCPII